MTTRSQSDPKLISPRAALAMPALQFAHQVAALFARMATLTRPTPAIKLQPAPQTIRSWR